MTIRDGIFAGDDPFALAQAWLDEATSGELNDPSAMALATTDGDGLPNVRIVLLKEIEANGFVFYSNHTSVKGQEIAANPRAALAIHWKSLRRQIRARGSIEMFGGEQADRYYASRSLASRHGAWASQQSQALDTRETLVAAAEEVAATKGDDPKRPPFWGGYRITPLEIEFWADGPARLHDRFRWTRKAADAAWEITRLYP